MVGDKIGNIVLYVLRHGEVAEDKEGTIRGLLNPKLDAKGRRDAAAIPAFFKDILLSFVVTDDLKRTMQTAKPLADAKKLRMEIDPDLRSWDVGTELEGEQIEDNKDEIAKLKTHPQLVPVGGQSWGDYERQVDESFYKYVDRSLEQDNPGAIVVHGSYIQHISIFLRFKKPDDAYDHTPIDPAGIIGIYLTRQGLVMKILQGEKNASDE